MIGELIDHYRVQALVGRGAMGVVYKALDVNLDRTVAIKVMSAEARSDPDFVERFRQEARVQGALNHPNVALLFDYFVHDGAPVAVMEFIDGESLEELIRRRGAIPAREAIPIFKQALRGVAAAHRAGIIHRDLKPGNLMVTRDNTVKVMDFGIAKRQGVTGATKVSTSIGSPLYMAPEQILGRAVDCRTDVYALGITLYELLSGYRPFNARGKAEYLVLNAHVNDVPEPPTVYRRGIPQPIVDAVMRSLAKEPEARFQSAEDFMHALPDVTAPDAAAPQAARAGTVALEPKAAAPRVGPGGTVAIPRAAGPTGTVAIPQAAPGSTVTLDYAPPTSGDSGATRKPGATMAFEYAASKHLEPHDSMEFNYSAGTVWQQLHPPDSSPSPAPPASPPGEPTPSAQGLGGPGLSLRQRLRAYRPAVAAVIVAALVLGTLAGHPEWLHATPTAAQTPPSTEPATPPPAVPSPEAEPVALPSADATVAAQTPPAATTRATAAVPSRPDLSGTWRGAYIDASGRQLLRVVSLSISRVHEDGGIEGTLQYEAASGRGECKLHPRGSTYSAGEQRLQLSPEGCTAHYPRELGVPLDFDGVNPQANALSDGRIEAPTGEVIKVELKRVSGA